MCIANARGKNSWVRSLRGWVEEWKGPNTLRRQRRMRPM